MPETLEIPIGQGDVNTSPDHKTVVLPTEKFSGLIEYVEQLEDTLKFTEFDLARAQKFSELLIKFLTKAIDIMPYLQQKDFWSTRSVIRQAFHEWTEAVAEGVGNGTITGEQAKLLEEKVLSLVAVTDWKPEGEAEGGGGGTD